MTHNIIAADTGHQIVKVQVGDRVVYSAFAPTIPYGEYRPLLRVHYAIGETIPQQAEHIGVFETAEEAKAACTPHLP